jgi:Concanavalin A-like lectin/glucanases superfamily/Right handed beta helix region
VSTTSTATIVSRLARLSFPVLSIALSLFCQLASASTFYVATTGSDSNPGTITAPYLTLQQAANKAVAGDTVIVRDGTYGHAGAVTGGDSANTAISAVVLYNSGTPSAWITFKAENKRSAILDCEMICDSYFNLLNASYIVIQDFVITRGYKEGIHSNDAAHHITLRGNEISYIANRSTTVNLGLDGIYTNPNCHDFIFDGNAIHDIGRTNYNWLDHGLYLHGSNYTITNNIFYNTSRGWAIQMADGLSNVQIANNSFAFPGAQDGQIMMWNTQSNLTIQNNIFYAPTNYAISRYTSSVSSCSIDHNLVYGASGMMADSSGCTLGVNQVGPNPMFVNIATAPYDFHVQTGGPGIDAGVNLAAVTRDFYGATRPQGSSTDAGASEYVAAVASGPVISGVFVSGITNNAAYINWSTNAAATSYAQYGPSGYTATTPQDPTLITTHTVALSSLASSTLYHFRGGSQDSAGNLTLSSDYTFTTAAPVASTFAVSAASPAASMVQGQSTTDGIAATIVTGGGLTVSFSASGLPRLVSATISPSSCMSTCNALLTLSSTSKVSPGTYNIVVKGTNGGITSSTTVALTVSTPTSSTFALSTTSPTASVVQGLSTTDGVAATIVTGVNVSFSASGQPSGVSAAISPSSCMSTCNTVLTLSTTSAAAPGTYNIVVKGTSGGVSSSATVALTVSAAIAPVSTFAVSATAPSVSVVQGLSATDGVAATIVSGGGLNVSFSASGQQGGVSATISPSSCMSTCSTMLTLSTTSAASPGTYNIVVTGASGGISSSATIALTVSAPAAPTDVLTGLAARWSFSEALSTNGTPSYASDSSGNANTANLGGAKWATGTYGGAVSLSGSGQYLSVNESPSLEMTQQLTVSFWLNANSTSNVDPRVISKAYDWDVKLNGANRYPQFSAGGNYAMLNYSLPLNTWQHITFTFSSAAGLKGYVNGAPVAFSANTFSGQSLPAYAYGLLIGADTGLSTFCAGLIDEVRVYNRALSDSEVSTVYAATAH